MKATRIIRPYSQIEESAKDLNKSHLIRIGGKLFTLSFSFRVPFTNIQVLRLVRFKGGRKYSKLEAIDRDQKLVAFTPPPEFNPYL